MSEEIGESEIKKIFHKLAHSNIHRYHQTIDDAFSNYVESRDLALSPDDTIKLKRYMWATIATENYQCEPVYEDVNTNMW